MEREKKKLKGGMARQCSRVSLFSVQFLQNIQNVPVCDKFIYIRLFYLTIVSVSIFL